MNLYREQFGFTRRLLPVVHVETVDQTRLSVENARSGGADGVFLISHTLGSTDLLTIYNLVRGEHPDWWIGLNELGTWPGVMAQTVPSSVSGVWTDDSLIREHQDEQHDAGVVWYHLTNRKIRPVYFGGVAFKYKREVENLEAAASKAVPFMDVVTTTGPGTGRAADLEKVRRMRDAMGDAPLALASGITAPNVADYMPFVDCFLVASSITDPGEVINEARVRELLSAMGRT